MKLQEIYEQIINEINMSPSSLKSLARNIDARAGMEFELIVPGASVDDDSDMEPDWDEDRRARSWSDIEDFFLGDGDWNSRRDVSGLIEELQSEFFEWADERIYDDFIENSHQIVYDYIKDNASDNEIGEDLELEPDEDGDYVIEKKDYLAYTEYCIENENNYYEEARDNYRDDAFGDMDESDWLDEKYPYMSDIQSNFSISWPYYTTNQESNVEEIAQQFEDAIGKRAHWSDSYHGARRTENGYSIEPDGSLDADSGEAGLEFISHPMPIDEMFDDLDKVVAWANRVGAYTNSSTGLHMNVSVPNFSNDKLDYVKLALLLGDEYVLNQFGRLSNTYCKSAIKIVKDRIKDRPEDAEAMLRQMKEHLADIATKVIHSGETNKFTSINTKDGYVEFRSPGGDWLDGDIEKVKNTLLRFVVALDASIDPQKYRNEYLKKLYLVLQPKGEEDALAYFAKYASGTIDRSELKGLINQVRLRRDMKKGNTPAGKKYWWEVKRPGYMASIEVVASSKEEAIEVATKPENYPDWANAANLEAKPLRPYEEKPKNNGGEFTGNWLIKSPEGATIYRFGGIGNRQTDANATAMQWLRSHPEHMRDGLTVVPEMR